MDAADLQEQLEEATSRTKALMKTIEVDCMNAVQESSNSADWGVRIEAVNLDGFELLDRQIMEDLAKITQSSTSSSSSFLL